MRKYLSVLLALALVASMLSGCSGQEADITIFSDETTSTEWQESTETPESTAAEENNSEMFTNRDQKTEYDESAAVTIRLDGSPATASSDSVKINGSTVILSEEATYVISGSFDGMLVVNAADTAKLQIVFDGVDITSETSAALYILEADKVFVTLADGTENYLSNGGSFVAIDDNNIDAALFSKQDLTLNGSGSLTVTSPAGHGIVCKDDLVITGGTYVMNAASHGLDANDSVRIADANLTIDAGKDAIHCENTDDTSKGFIYIESGTITAEAEGDGIAAGAWLQIEDGVFDLLVGGGSVNGESASSGNYGGFMGGGHRGTRPGSSTQSTTTTEDSVSMKGVKATGNIVINGGIFTIDSADDSIHSDASVTIYNGSYAIATGDDAIHAEETLTVVSGTIDISKSYEGLEALHIIISGGDITLTASDDGLNAAGGTDSSGTTGGRDGMFGGGMGGGMSSGNGSIVISGGDLYINASGDGIDANGTIEISGGYTVVVGPSQGDTATLDYDRSAVITGGTFIGTGASGMAQTFSSSEQGVVAVSVGNQSAGTQITLTDKNGNVIVSYTPELSYAVVILSDPAIISGETYTITVGSQSGEFKAN